MPPPHTRTHTHTQHSDMFTKSPAIISTLIWLSTEDADDTWQEVFLQDIGNTSCTPFTLFNLSPLHTPSPPSPSYGVKPHPRCRLSITADQVRRELMKDRGGKGCWSGWHHFQAVSGSLLGAAETC